MSTETSATVPTPAHEPSAGDPHTAHDRLRTDLARIWGDVLGTGPVDATADFTELGGNSLPAAQIAARVRTRLGTHVSVAELFEHGTVTALARLRADRPRDTGDALPPVTPAPGDGPLLAPAQRRLWFLDQLSPAAGTAYNVPALTRLRGPLDTTALDAAWQDVVDRHEQLRTVFTFTGGVLHAEPTDSRAGLDLVDLTGHPNPYGHGLRAADERAARLGLPVKSLFLAAHARALAELTASERTVTAVQVNGRLEEPGSDRVLGLLLNMVPLHLTAGGTWAELAGAAFDAERERQPYRRYPLAALLQLTGGGTPLFNVAFNYTDFHVFDELAALRAISPRDWWFSDQHSFPLMVEITRTPHTGRRALAVTLGAGSPYAATGARLMLHALHAVAADPHATVSPTDSPTEVTEPRR
uniref:Condensation domain-containing protein n=1 Tax=Streptomyces sp. NBC_00003 TaxID=2903608 RepID=A0AAU2VDB7_9ACTN